MIELESAGKRFGRRPGVQALRGVTLQVPRGQVCGVAGPNGAGKSTLLSLVLGFLRPTEGRVRVDGEEPRQRHRAGGVAFLPERFTLPARWTVEQALRGLAVVDGEADPRGRVERALVRFRLEPFARRAVAELSRGTLQRVGLAQAWLASADVLVLDEPTEGLDPLWRLELRGLIAERRDGGAAVLVASHDLHALEQVADRVVLLEGGQVRDVVSVRSAAGAGLYRLHVVAGAEHVASVFPDARGREADVFLVEVADAPELSARIAALLERGAILGSVAPVALEDRLTPGYGEE